MLVSIDTLRADRLGCYGYAGARTPNLDALAARGVRFEQAISPAPLTLPSHATLLTGLDPPEHGVRANGSFRLGPEVPTLAAHLGEAGFATAGFVGAFILERRFGLARGFDVYDDDTTRASRGRAIGVPRERRADEVTAAALAWLEDAPARFFLFVHYYDPHREYTPPPGFAAALPGRPYDGEIAFVDFELGKLFEAVEQRFPDGRTLFVVAADHGEALGDHGELSHSIFLYEPTQRVPLLLRGPGLPEGGVVPGVAALRDVAPTLLDAVGAEPLPGLGGRSLLPRARGERTADPPPAYMESTSPQLDWGLSALLGLRTSRWKYVRAPRPELYDLEADPGESQNLAAAEPARLETLDRELEQRVRGARASRRTLSDEERAGLEALGYVAAGAAAPAEVGHVGGDDPKDLLPVVNAILMANSELTLGRPGEALALLDELDPEASRRIHYFHLVLATAAIEAGAFDRAREAARAAVEAQPELSESHLLEARTLEADGALEAAARSARRASELAPESGDAWLQLGSVAEARGQPREAELAYRKALEVDDPTAAASWRLAAVLLEAGREDEFEALRKAAEGTWRDDPAAAIRLARAEAAAGRGDAALARLEDAAQRHPESTDVGAERAALLSRRGSPEARDAWERLLSQVVQSAEPGLQARWLLLRVRALRGLGRLDEARAACAEALGLRSRLDAAGRGRLDALAEELGGPQG